MSGLWASRTDPVGMSVNVVLWYGRTLDRAGGVVERVGDDHAVMSVNGIVTRLFSRGDDGRWEPSDLLADVRRIDDPDAPWWRGRFVDELVGMKVIQGVGRSARTGRLDCRDGVLYLDDVPVFSTDVYGFVAPVDDRVAVERVREPGNGFRAIRRPLNIGGEAVVPPVLWPCPLCGGNRLEVDCDTEPGFEPEGDWYVSVACTDCGLLLNGDWVGSDPSADRVDRALKGLARRWNTRR